MITPPANWNDLYNSDDDASLEVRVSVECCANITIDYYNDDISSNGVTIQHALYNEVSVGGAVSAIMTFSVYDAVNALILQKGQKATFSVRLSDGETVTDWVDRGVFYIDSVTANDDDSVSVTAYDEMGLLDEYQPGFTEDITVSAYADLLNDIYGCSMLADSSLLGETVYVEGITKTIGAATLPYEEIGDTTARDIVASIAALLGGNAYIDYTGALRVASPFGSGTGTTVDVTAGSITRDRKITRANCVIIVPSKTISIPLYSSASTLTDFKEFPDHTGIATRVGINAIFAPTNGKDLRVFAHSICNKVYGNDNTYYKDYVGFIASGAHVTPLFELLDTASVDVGSGNTESFVISSYRVTFGGECAGELSKPLVGRSLQPNMQRMYVNSLMGWDRYEWALSGYGYESSYGQNIWRLRWAYESDRTFLAYFYRGPAYPSSQDYDKQSLYKIIGGQEITFTFSYYYDSTGAIHRNATVTGYSQEQVLGNAPSNKVPFIRFYTEDAIDIDKSRPYSVSAIMVRSSLQSEQYGVAFDMYYARAYSDNN